MAISDDKNTNLLNDELSRSRTGITVTGTAKSDDIKGTSRNDVLDGGAGSDKVDAGSGNDVLIYRLAQNLGARDRYDGGSGVDLLRLEFTAAEWMRADVRADITRFLTALQNVTIRGEESEGNSNWFSFKAFGLEVRKIEFLEIRVDGLVVNPGGEVTPAPVANADVANVAEGAVVSGNVLANDQVTNATVSLVSNVTRGTLVLNANGSYTFTAGPAFDVLANGQSTTETFTYRITDAQGRTATAGVTITVAGTNDAAVITGTSTASLTETNAAQSASGQLNVTDVDGAASFVAQTGAAGQYGSFSIDATGAWTYTMGSAHDEFVAGQNYSDSFTVATADGTTQVITVTIAGTNDAAAITGTSTASLAETDAAQSASGQLNVTDVDGAASFVAQSGTAGQYGSFSINAAGAWTYTMGAAHDEFVAGQNYSDSFTVAAADGTTQVITVTITGTNDTAVITGTNTAGLTETNAAQSASGQLNVTDVDGAASFVAQSGTAGLYGSFSIDATGAWTYAMGAAHDEFVAGQNYSDSFTVATADGTTQVVTVNIAGSNDAAVISGFFTGSIETDAPLTITGKLDVTDIDGPDEFIAQSGIAGVNGRGSFAIDAAGNWTFTANSAFNELAVGQYLIDYAEVSAADGTRQLISITINGSNDGPVISGGVISGAVTEDTALTASGQLTASDADAGAMQTWSVQGAATGIYGSFAVDQAGQWTYTLDNANHQDLAAGESHVETFIVRVTDEYGAYADQAVSVTVSGSNDEAVISGFFTGSIETDVPLTITGKLDVTDIDGPDEFIAQSGIVGINGLGSFAIDSAGNWVFNANSAFNELAVGQYIYDYAEVSTADGTRLYLSITINGTNDGAVITGDSAASITESNVAQTVSGQLNVSDVDSTETFVAQTDTVGLYGSFSINAAGAWTYTMGATHDEFVAGQNYEDSFTVATADNTQQVITVTIAGTNDVAIITGSGTASLTETDAAQSASGQLSVEDVDSAANFVAQVGTTGLYGSFSIDASGAWTYTMDAAHDEFVAGQNYTDSFTVATADNTQQVITVTITGTNDSAIITGTSTASLTETNVAQAASGQLSADDVDSATTFVAQSGAAGQYGSFSIDATGAWTYAMGAAHDEFVAGQTYTDSFTVASADNTQQVITVTIAGTNDAAIITGTSTASLTETDTAQTASGQLSADDVDSATTFVAQSGTAGQYGSFSIDASGAWAYTMDAAYDEFVAGQNYTDSFTVATADATEQVVTVTITGTNDAAIISGSSTASLTETNVAQTASGQLSVSDIDSPETVVAQSGTAGQYGSFSIDATGAWTYTMGSAHDEFVAGQTYSDSFTVATADGATQVVTVAINGTNDGPVAVDDSITATEDTAFSSVVSLIANDTDVDGPTKTAVEGTFTTQQGGTLVLAADGSYTYTPAANFNGIDSVDYTVTDGTLSDVGTLTITVNAVNDSPVAVDDNITVTEDAAFSSLVSLIANDTDVDGPTKTAVAGTFTTVAGGTLVLATDGSYTYTPALNFSGTDTVDYTVTDGTFNDIGTLTINVNAVNDVPVITGGTQSGAVTEDVADIATGQLTATDPDTGAQQFWTVEGGTPAGNADFLFKADSLTVTRNGTTIFQDSFSDGIAPPVGPDGVTESYGGVGSVQLTESGGKLLLDSDGVQSFVGIANSDPQVGVNAIVKTNINPASTNNGLKSTANFTASAVFDLILPDSPRENYGLRFTDRVVGGNGTPPDQLGDNVVDFRVSMREDGSLVVRLQQRSFVTDSKQLLEAVALTPPAGADQIRLNLAHATAHVGQVVASFDYLALGSVVGSYTFAATGTIFQGENFTRAEIIASAPAINDSAIGGTYGTLNVDQTGTWTYTLNDGLATTQSLAAGQTAFDTFTLKVTDENGASDSETVTITVTGTNDTPEVQTGTVSRALTEDAATSLTASGAGQFADVDLNDTHTVAAVLTSAGLNNSATLPAGLQALLADAVAVTLPDVATGDAHGQYLWDFAVANSAVQFLAAGQTLTLAYDITVTDNHGAAATQRVNVTITGANDAPVITSAATATFAENATGTVYTATATDADSAVLSYTIGGTDAALFNINASTGAVSFKNAPNYEAPADVGGNNVYDITVSASDGVNSSAAQGVAISVTDVLESLAGQSVIDLGSFGKLIAPVQVDGGKWYYYWDRSGNGTNANTGTLNGGVDNTTHDVLDGIFNKDINGVVGGGGNTTDTYRYATLNGVQVALPTAGGQSSPPYGSGGISNFQPGTTVGSSPATTGSNAVNATYNDLLAVWDAYNGTGTGVIANGTPSGWQASAYWSATPSASGHAIVNLNLGYVDFSLTFRYVALQVL